MVLELACSGDDAHVSAAAQPIPRGQSVMCCVRARSFGRGNDAVAAPLSHAQRQGVGLLALGRWVEGAGRGRASLLQYCKRVLEPHSHIQHRQPCSLGDRVWCRPQAPAPVGHAALVIHAVRMVHPGPKKNTTTTTTKKQLFLCQTFFLPQRKAQRASAVDQASAVLTRACTDGEVAHA